MHSLYAELTLVTFIALLVRWIVSFGPYSGKGKPPMFGDYEAQRHWQEVTTYVNIGEWYTNSSENDLQYWGLDYPPLTAYHSWILGKLANLLNPSWTELHTSRGFESYTHKLFMRYSVLVTDVLIYIPAVFLYIFKAPGVQNPNLQNKAICSLAILLYPGLILIDYGHFQYNSISLGFGLWCVIAVATGHDILASIAFCLALNYKQMELYHAMPVFCYLLATCFHGKENWLVKLSKLGIVVITTFVVIWLPFLREKGTFFQVVHRLFPFARGLYEDKVANFWCSVSVVVKIKQLLHRNHIVVMCLISTLIGLLPSSIHLILKPSVKAFKYAMVNASLVFFLFSFQVHEKSILICALPVCLLLADHPVMCTWFLIISTFSMLPLLIKDGLMIQFVATTALFYLISSSLPGFRLRKEDSLLSVLFSTLIVSSLIGATVLTVVSVTVRPPPRLPDLFPVLISIYACGHFLLFLVYFHYLQFTCTVEQDVKTLVTQKSDKSWKRKKQQ